MGIFQKGKIMANRFYDGNNTGRKRRKCYYAFSKEYPGMGSENRRNGIGDEFSFKTVAKKILIVLLIIFCFVLSYFVVYTVISISREEVEGLDGIGMTTNAENITQSDTDMLEEYLNQQNSQTTTQQDESDIQQENLTQSDISE